MGADGGVCWVDVTDEEQFRALVGPLGFLNWDDYHDSNWEWVQEQEEIPNRVYATYGTSLDVTLELLQELLWEVDGILEGEDWIRQPEWLSITFREMVLDYQTQPENSRIFRSGFDYLYDHIRFWVDSEDDDVLDMPVGEWAAQVATLVVPESFGSVETWT